MSSTKTLRTFRGWGNYPTVEGVCLEFGQEEALRGIIADHTDLIPFGNGRSYGDSALSSSVIDVRSHNLFLEFDEAKGFLRIQAGVLLSEILDVVVPRGWFLPITPGTKLITVGGAIASDVHGKNHHLVGCFSECVAMFRLMLPDGRAVTCSRTENVDLFRATCGGMGLTGVILEVSMTLKSINSAYIAQTTIKTGNLRETFSAFEANAEEPYSVAWIDCLATGGALGRSLLMVGDFCDDGQLDYRPPRKLNVPVYFPSFILNSLSVRAFNGLYYSRVRKRTSQQRVHLDTFFYPLDAIKNWNRIYGKAGFTQYQFILPKAASFNGLHEILATVAGSKKGSFLAVLKLYGPANANLLSFPMEGYSLALDFKLEAGLFRLLERLDQIVVNHGGRIYLAKDARVNRESFEQGYPRVDEFRALRQRYGMSDKFNSLQSRRVGI